MTKPYYFIPNWPIPKQVRAYVTTKICDNLAAHIVDDITPVLTNRQKLFDLLTLPNEPLWLSQTHSTVAIDAVQWHENIVADASFSREAQQVCVVLTADCLPILICNRQGDEIAAIHAGWRGLCDGVIEATIAKLHSPGTELLAWLGPAISQSHFEVDESVRQAFIAHDCRADLAFIPTREHHYHCCLYTLAKQRLAKCGITNIYGGDRCTYAEQNYFFSHRREQPTGRMATLIWIET